MNEQLLQLLRQLPRDALLASLMAAGVLFFVYKVWSMKQSADSSKDVQMAKQAMLAVEHMAELIGANMQAGSELLRQLIEEVKEARQDIRILDQKIDLHYSQK